MNKTTKLITGAIIILLGLLAISSIEKSNEASKIRIGAILPLTGKLANLGEDVRNSLELAREEIKVKEGVDFEIIYEDSAADAKIAVPAAQKLITADKVQVLIGGPGSTSNLAVVPLVEASKIPFIAISATPKLNESGVHVFKIIPDINGEVLLMARHLIEHGHKTVAFMYDSSADSNVTGRDVFVAEYQKLGGKVLLNEGYDTKTVTDFRPVLTKVKGKAPSALYFLGTDIASSLAIRQAREVGLTQDLYGWSGAESRQFIETAGSATEGFTLTTFKFSCDEGDQAALAFCDAYRSKFAGRTPLHYGAHAYDLLYILKDIAKDLVEPSAFGSATEAALTSHSYSGLTGQLDFNAEGNIVDKDFVFRTVQAGKFIEVK